MEVSMSDLMRPFEQPARLTRRTFTLDAALALLAGCVITITDACSSSNTNPANPSPATADIIGVISANHGHTATLKGADITAGVALVLNIQGSAAHTHIVSLSEANLQTLKNRQPVSKDSSNDVSATFGLHLHNVTFTPV
jgi:hypothetical protein